MPTRSVPRSMTITRFAIDGYRTTQTLEPREAIK